MSQWPEVSPCHHRYHITWQTIQKKGIRGVQLLVPKRTHYSLRTWLPVSEHNLDVTRKKDLNGWAFKWAKVNKWSRQNKCCRSVGKQTSLSPTQQGVYPLLRFSLSGIQKPSECFRPSKSADWQAPSKTRLWRSEKCRGESVRSGGGIILALAPAYSPFLPWSLFWGAASLLRAQSWEGEVETQSSVKGDYF